jgi:UDP-N-acetylmuramyl-tripeptide synthetase
MVTVGDEPINTVWAESGRQNLSGISGRLHTPRGEIDFHSPLVGKHNRENILCAAGAAMALEIAPEAVKTGIETVTRIPGRLEPVNNESDRYMYVDYAHTPDALRNVLSALRALESSRIICVFGCGGDRDRRKRPLMGEIAGQLSDLCVVTSDNPRSEPPQQIIAEILPGIRRAGLREYRQEELRGGFAKRGFVVEPDRRRAIRLAAAASVAGDTILIAGKGHETYQILGTRTIDFDDRVEGKAAMRAASKDNPVHRQPA